jgi:hypothetical protein
VRFIISVNWRSAQEVAEQLSRGMPFTRRRAGLGNGSAAPQSDGHVLALPSRVMDRATLSPTFLSEPVRRPAISPTAVPSMLTYVAALEAACRLGYWRSQRR